MRLMGKQVVTRNTLEVRRVGMVALVVFAINFLPPIMNILQTNQMPTLPEFLYAVCLGIMQVATILYGLLKLEESKGEQT